MSSASPMPPLDPERIRKIRDALTQGLVEREVPVRLALLAALAGEHLLLIGPPGTAKSLIARRLRLALKDGAYFERLLTRFSVPEELFGPLSVKALEEDKYQRQTQAYLPTASVAFLDEIFKANSAILNALLTLLNERMFDNGTRRETTPLVAVIGASNELPEGPELGALYDRFLLRLHVGPVSKDGFKDLLSLRGEGTPEIPDELKLTDAELKAWQAAAEEVSVPDDVLALLGELREWCLAEKLTVSDRRWRKLLKLLQVSALTNGRTEVAIWDCWLVQHCLWETPEQREGIYDWYAKRVGASAPLDPARTTTLVLYWEAAIGADEASQSQARDSAGRLLFKDGNDVVAGEMQPVSRYGESVYLAPVGAKTSVGHWRDPRWEPVDDRTAGGTGYTEEELAELQVDNLAFTDWPYRQTYLDDPASRLMEKVTLPPILETTRYADSYVADQLGQLAEHQELVAEYLAELEQQRSRLSGTVGSHLWLTADFTEPAFAGLTHAHAAVTALQHRLEVVAERYRDLPRLQRPAPAP